MKLDISITRDIDSDRGRRALASAMISFADEMGMAIVAEGVETPAEHAVLQELGVPFGQGYLFARPAPLRTPRRPLQAAPPPADAPEGAMGARSTVPSRYVGGTTDARGVRVERIKVMIAEDESAVREALADLVESDPEWSWSAPSRTPPRPSRSRCASIPTSRWST